MDFKVAYLPKPNIFFGLGGGVLYSGNEFYCM